MLTLLSEFVLQLSTHLVRLGLHLAVVFLFHTLFVNHTLIEGHVAIPQLKFRDFVSNKLRSKCLLFNLQLISNLLLQIANGVVGAVQFAQETVDL